MKYGDNISQISVPKWSIHNVDYNTLKLSIKVNTKRDEAKAKAIAIPGQQDTVLDRFESELFNHMRQEHDRVNLFVYTTSHELSRRLEHLSYKIHRLIVRCKQSSRTSQKRYANLLRCEHELLQVGEDINNLPRFVHAQVEAFRKIMKKYRKWTGSSTLGHQFKLEVLGNPKTFTHLNFSDLKIRFEDLIREIKGITPKIGVPQSPTTSRRASTAGVEPEALGRRNSSNVQGYWNEYDHGSEAGDFNDEYVIWVSDPDGSCIDGSLRRDLTALVTKPISTVRSWLSPRRQTRDEEQSQAPLLVTRDSSISYGGTVVESSGLDSNDEGISSEDEYPPEYEAHYASPPNINEQRADRLRNTALLRGALGLFATSSVLLIVAAIFISTGRHKLMMEISAGVTIGIATALACTFLGLAMFFLRTEKSEPMLALVVLTWFTLLCAASGALLVEVVDGLIWDDPTRQAQNQRP